MYLLNKQAALTYSSWLNSLCKNKQSTGCANKNNSLAQLVYFSNSNIDLSQTFRLYVSIHTTYPANFINS